MNPTSPQLRPTAGDHGPLAAWLWAHVATRLRTDAYARYLPPKEPGGRAGYAPVRGGRGSSFVPLAETDLQRHLSGEQPVGCYLINPAHDGLVRGAVVDLDDKERALTWGELCGEALKVNRQLEGRGLTALPVRSGSGHGIHLWCLWADHQNAGVVRGELRAAVGAACLSTHVHVDLFPAQAALGSPDAAGVRPLGNLVALPFSRASVPIMDLATGACCEDLGAWAGVQSSPALSRDLGTAGGGAGSMRRGQGVGSRAGDARSAPPDQVMSGEAGADLSGDEGRGLQNVVPGQDDREYGPTDPVVLADALRFIPAEEQSTWVRVALALKGAIETGQLDADVTFRVWDDWCKTGGDKYNEADNHQQWHRHLRWREGGITLGSVFFEAGSNGWVPPVRVIDRETGEIAPVTRTSTNEASNAADERLPALQHEISSMTPAGLMRAARKFKEKTEKHYRELLRWKEGDGGVEKIGALNEDHFQAFDGGRLYICKERWDASLSRWVLEHRSVRDFRDANLDIVRVLAGTRQPTQQNPSGQIIKDRHLGDLWLESPFRRRYEEVVFRPKDDHKDWQYNLWRGWSETPSEAGSWDLFRDHIFTNICRKDQVAYDYIFKWLAYTAQNMDEPIGTALVLRGNKGTGKGFFVKKIGQLFGQHFLQVSSTKGVTGSFNAHLRDCVLLFADEAFCSGSPADEARLNALITEETIPIEGKGRDVVTCRNMLHVIMATNKDWAVPATGDERRFCCVNVGDGGQLVRGYFDKVDEQLRAGGLARLLWDLLHEDLEGWDRKQVPSTSELYEQKYNNLPPDGKWWRGRILDGMTWPDSGGWQRKVVIAALYEDYLSYCRVKRTDGNEIIGSPRGLGQRIALMITGDPKAKLDSVSKLVKRGEFAPIAHDAESFESAQYGIKKRLWLLPKLSECRKGFDDWLRVETLWDPEINEDVNEDDGGGAKNEPFGTYEDESNVLF